MQQYQKCTQYTNENYTNADYQKFADKSFVEPKISTVQDQESLTVTSFQEPNDDEIDHLLSKFVKSMPKKK